MVEGVAPTVYLLAQVIELGIVWVGTAETPKLGM